MDNAKDLLINLYQKNLKELTDKLKVQIFDKLIELSETRPQGMLFKEELQVIRDGVEEAREKRKDEEIKAIGDVMNSLVERFGEESDFEEKVDKKIEATLKDTKANIEHFNEQDKDKVAECDVQC